MGIILGLFRSYIGIMEANMETTILGLGFSVMGSSWRVGGTSYVGY